jgi:hypothetical protein
MTTQYVYAGLRFSDGTTGLFEESVTDDAVASEVKSDATFYVVASSAGDQFPGRTITHAVATAKTFLAYAYILSRSGTVACVLPVQSRTAMQDTPMLPVMKPYTLQAGDTLICRTNA